MGRIFVGLCQVGAWGCFDEFNRLEERMLSAVSQQIQIIQVALKEGPKDPGKKCDFKLFVNYAHKPKITNDKDSIILKNICN